MTHPAQAFLPPWAVPKGRAPGRSLSRKDRNQRPGPSGSWCASHSLRSKRHLPWLLGTFVFGVQGSVGSTGAHGPRQSFGAWVPGKGLPSATKWLWLPAPKTSVDPYGSHWLHGEHESGGSAPALGSWNRWLVGQARRRGWKACLWAQLTEPSLSMWGSPEER